MKTALAKNPSTWLYPEIEPNRSGKLKVSDIHEIYWEESGNPNGAPVVFVHGGPGGGTDGKNRRYFNPEKYRIVLFDQRGCGQSTPHACLEENTTWDLIADMEKLREMLGIQKWVVFGGSWGSTLSLTYAQTHSDKVNALVLRGIFMLRQKELKWFYQEGASYIYPDAFDPYREHIPKEEQNDLMAAYYKRLTSEDEKTRLEAARLWTVWEGSTSKLVSEPATMDRFNNMEFQLAFARIECHYFTNKGFFKDENQILNNVDKIRDIPSVIVQGRYDVVCPMQSAWDLHKAWPEAEFIVAPDAGHASSEPSISKALVSACDRFADLS